MLILMEAAPDGDGQNVAAGARALGHRVHLMAAGGSLSQAEPPLIAGGFEWGVLLSSAPSPERYRQIHDEARALNITLLNDSTQHRDAEELDRTLGALDGLTARSEVVTTEASVEAALQRLPLPVFVRGAVGSAKELGWKACVAQTLAEAQTLVKKLLALQTYSRGRVVLREVLPLRRIDKLHAGFPLSREYRLFVLDADVLVMGPSWFAEDPFGKLSEREESEVRALAHEVARRTRVPWLAIDVGQLEGGEWKVIETADPASCALGSVDPRVLVAALAHSLEQRTGC